MDLEAESTRIKVDTDVTKDIAQSCNKLLGLQEQMSKCEEHLKTLQNEARLLSEQEIPNLMQQAGVSMLKLADGSSVEVKPLYTAKFLYLNKMKLILGFVIMDMGILLKTMSLLVLVNQKIMQRVLFMKI